MSAIGSKWPAVTSPAFAITIADFAAAFERALAQERPALLELRVDREAITPRQTLSQIRAEARATSENR
jgi:acetolactate synthase-1/2/3 large subunit